MQHMCMCNICAYMHILTQTHTYTYVHTVHTFTHAQTYIYKHKYANVCECMNSHTQAHAHALPIGYRLQKGAVLEAGPPQHISPHMPKSGNGLVPEAP